MERRIRVMHYYTYPENSGGPLTYINNLMHCRTLEEIVFGACFQNKPLSRLRIKDMRRIVSEIKLFAPDLLQVHGVQSEGLVGWIAGRVARVPKILLTVHGLQQDAQTISRVKRFLYARIIEPFVLRHSDAVYCVCDAMTSRAYLQKHAHKLLPTIPCFLPCGDRAPEKQLHDPSIRNYCFVGRVSIDKGMQELEECILMDQNMHHQYWIIGSGDYEARMRRNLQEKIRDGNVIFFGQRNDVQELLARADVFVFPSHHENLSFALLEACYAGLPSIVTDVGGNTEVVRNGIEGIVIKANHAQMLYDAVCDLDNGTLIEQLGKNAHARVLSTFSDQAIGKTILDLYRTLAESIPS